MTVPVLTFHDDRELPQLGLGTYKLRGEDAYRVVREAIEVGYRHFDTATLYDNEAELGRAFRDAMAAGDITRDELFVTSKVWHSHHGAGRVQEAFRESMSKLDLGYLDLYLVHWPWERGGRYVETFEEIAKMQGMGQIASVGVANFYEKVLQEIISRTGVAPVLNQVELHPGFTQPQLRAFHEERDIITEAWAPLARGIVFANPQLQAIAQAHDATEAQICLAFLMALGVSVVPKASSRERLTENFAAASIELSAEEIAQLSALDNQPGFGRIFADPREFPEDEPVR